VFDDFSLFLDLLVEFDINAMKNFQYQDLHTEGCILSSINLFSIRSLLLGASSVQFYFLDGESETDLSYLAERLFNLLADPQTLSNIDAKISQTIENANSMCINGYIPLETDDDHLPETDSFTAISWKFKIAALVAFCLFFCLFLNKIFRSLGIVHLNYLEKKTLSISSNFPEMDSEIHFETSSHSAVVFLSNEWWTLHIKRIFSIHDDLSRSSDHIPLTNLFVYDALIASDTLSPWIRVFLPPVSFVLMFALAISLMHPAAYVMMEIKVGERVLGDAAIFNFGYGGTVRDLWVAKAYFLSILITLFTGVWPFIKLVSILVAWVLPTSLLSLKWRDSILRWVDILGKWSLVDTFVMVLMMVAFHVKFSVVPGVTVGLTVSPHWQFYTFLCATMGSLVVGHVAIGCHRAVTEAPVIVDDSVDQPVESIMNHNFLVKLPLTSTLGESKTSQLMKISFTSLGKVFVFLLLSFGLFLAINGTLLPTVTFELKGLTGYLMSDPTSSYSLVDVGMNVPAASGSPQNFGVRFIQFSYFLFAISIPIAFLFILLLLWVIPLKLTTQKSIIMSVEMLNAWNAMDVFVLSIIASVLEIKQYAKFLVGDHCDAINSILRQEMEAQLGGDPTCFDVVARMKLDSAVVCLAAIYLSAVGLPYISLCHKMIAERLMEENDRESVAQWVNQKKTCESYEHLGTLDPDKVKKYKDQDCTKCSSNLSWKTRFVSSSILWAHFFGLVKIHQPVVG